MIRFNSINVKSAGIQFKSIGLHCYASRCWQVIVFISESLIHSHSDSFKTLTLLSQLLNHLLNQFSQQLCLICQPHMSLSLSHFRKVIIIIIISQYYNGCFSEMKHFDDLCGGQMSSLWNKTQLNHLMKQVSHLLNRFIKQYWFI